MSYTSACSHINPKSFAEKLAKMGNGTSGGTLYQVINLVTLPPVVADHIISLLSKHRFTPDHFPYFVGNDLYTILSPPFPTPPLQCGCQPTAILDEALKTIAYIPEFPPSTPATSRPEILSTLDSYKLVTTLPSPTPSDIFRRIELQVSIHRTFLCMLPTTVDVTVALPSHPNIPTSFDIDRVTDDLVHCYSLYLAEQDQIAKQTELGSTLQDLGIVVPEPALSPTISAQTTNPPSLQPANSGSGIKTTNNTSQPSTPPNSSKLQLPASINTKHPTPSHITTTVPSSSTTTSSSSSILSSTRPASSSLRPSQKYHTLKVQKPETTVSITKIDPFGNRTPIHNDEPITILSNLASPQPNHHLSSVFNSPSPGHASAIAPQTTNGHPTTTNTQPNNLASSQASTSSRSSIEPIHPIETAHFKPPASTPTTTGGALYALVKSQQPNIRNTNPSPRQGPSISVNTAVTSVDSFNLSTPRGRSGTNPNLSQLSDRFAIGNVDRWVPYMKKNSQQLEDMLTSWDFSMLHDIQEQHRTEILLRLAVFMFVNSGVVQALNIPIDKLTHFLHHVSSLYRDNPYHNYLHAWTTLHYTYLLIKQTSANRRIEYSHTVTLSMLLASICHDIDHPGNNNHFEVQKMSKLALLHNDQSVLENHHCFVTFSLLALPEFSILSSLTSQQLKEVRGLIIAIILNTDMALHNDLTDSFGKASEELLNASESTTSDHATLSIKTSAAYGLIARVLVHCSDIAGQALPLSSAYPWAMRLRDEFMNQSDTESRLGLSVTPFMTGLDDITFAKSQLGFIRGVLRPLWVRMSITFPSTKPSLQHISSNEIFWDSFIHNYETAQGTTDKQRNFSITSTLTNPLRGPATGGKIGRKYSLDEHFVRYLQAAQDLCGVPEEQKTPLEHNNNNNNNNGAND